MSELLYQKLLPLGAGASHTSASGGHVTEAGWGRSIGARPVGGAVRYPASAASPGGVETGRPHLFYYGFRSPISATVVTQMKSSKSMMSTDSAGEERWMLGWQKSTAYRTGPLSQA